MRRLSPNEYATIKQLLNMGHNANKVAEIVGRSWCVVSTVKKSMSYAEYIEQRRAQARRAEENRKARQLPLDTPKQNNVMDIRQSIWIKYSSLYDELALYRRTPTGRTAEEQRDINMALLKLEEAEMWLKRHW